MGVFLTVCALSAAAAILASWFLMPRLVEAYSRLRRKTFVMRPETELQPERDVDMRAALTRLARRARPHLRLSNRSGWPERHRCEQACLLNLENSPEDCIVSAMVRQWYDGASCFLCSRPLGDFPWYEHHPAALSPDGVTVPWNEVAVSRLPEVLAAYSPICWNCHAVESFRREHGTMMVHRPTHIRSIH